MSISFLNETWAQTFAAKFNTKLVLTAVVRLVWRWRTTDYVLARSRLLDSSVEHRDKDLHSGTHRAPEEVRGVDQRCCFPSVKTVPRQRWRRRRCKSLRLMMCFGGWCDRWWNCAVNRPMFVRYSDMNFQNGSVNSASTSQQNLHWLVIICNLWLGITFKKTVCQM